MAKLASLIQYDGLKFHGLQRQKDEISVQQNLEEALETIFKEPVTIFAAGRTDTGVHARGMLVSYSAPSDIYNFYSFHRSVNALTDKGMSMLASKYMPEDFHAQFACTEREYEYHFLNTPQPYPLLENRAYFCRRRVDIQRLQEEITLLKGTFDFTGISKKASLQYKSSTIREIKEIELKEVPPYAGYYLIRIRGNSFLHNMIRILVGTLFDICSGKMGNQTIVDVIKKKDRTLAGKTLPPEGLYFCHAYYEKFPEIEELYREVSIP
ncbi:MAG: tRNA pseudouridine(38-40) synthase TruA [Leptospiraceae bacterium]|nr:tRNA pseudouridine(38-40) synthase TruA [Leptospiraceae bacterium]